jgi:RNA-directed DNA polymerase
VNGYQPRLKGRAFLIRYADDFVIGFTLEEDARRVMAVLPQRFGKYGLTVHPDKTQLVPFRPQRRAASDGQPPDDGPGTFTLLGFTHYWGRSRKGTWVLKRQTAASRFTRALRTITQWCRLHRHEPVALQHHTLSQKLRGHFAYYGITGNYVMLSRFRYVVTRVWRKWLGRRTRAGGITWSYFALLLERYPLPVPTVVHSVYRAKQNCNLRNRMR